MVFREHFMVLWAEKKEKKRKITSKA